MKRRAGWRGPNYPGELPSLGWYVLEWIEANLIVPDGATAGDPLELTGEQAQFVLDFYAVDPQWVGPVVQGRALSNARRVRRAVLSRPKGWGKSPILAALGLVEACGDIVLDGWDAAGEPVGRPWSSLGFKPNVQLLATSEDQTRNAWEPLLEMARNGPIFDNYEIEPLDTFVTVPNGRITNVTSAATSREGFRPVFAILDQTESWVPGVGGPNLAATTRRNLAKVQGSSIEAPNAFTPGANSVAEASFKAYASQQEGRTRIKSGILVDHREAPADTDPTDRDSLLAGLSIAYGDSADANGGFVALERILADYWDPDTDPQDARQYFLNQVTHAADSWLSSPEWAGCAALEKVVLPGEAITLGFDGSRKRSDAVTDATGLIGCRVSDGHLFELGVWEQPEGPLGKGWEVPRAEVRARVAEVFAHYNVVGFFADPAKWESDIAEWEAKYHARLKVQSSREHPIEWWMTGGRSSLTVRALEAFHDAVIQQQITHDGSSALMRHVLNARRRSSRSGIQIAKDHPESPRKIDAAVAAVLANTARLQALAAGLGNQTTTYRPKRLR